MVHASSLGAVVTDEERYKRQEYEHRWRAANIEHVRASARRRYADNPKRQAEASKKWLMKGNNHERKLERRRQWGKDNRKYLREYNRKHYRKPARTELTREKERRYRAGPNHKNRLKSKRLYRATYPERIREKNLRYRAANRERVLKYFRRFNAELRAIAKEFNCDLQVAAVIRRDFVKENSNETVQ